MKSRRRRTRPKASPQAPADPPTPTLGRERANIVSRSDIAAAGLADVQAVHRDYMQREKYLRAHGPQAYFKKYPRLHVLPHRVAIDAEACAIAGPVGANPDEIIRILYSRGDLNALFVTLDAEVTWERTLRAARVWRRIAKILEAAGWPFDTLPPPTGNELRWPHPLSKDRAAILSASHDVARAERKLRELQAWRRQRGINKGPQARSFQRCCGWR